ncbi:MAG: uncharacterized protein KVP18_004467 [Porospora cf. gigantea A]|uniref:uncharacterized protein n=1 Tax=Porospora cf. gigantea A TaxID=2853593 RepID=UPI003559F011|nr:MAG: hypothetical protein KVP18_004467 [Porospora cf. gigantea A]
MIEVTTKVQFDEALKESSGSLVFVHITRDHEPSQQIMDVVEMLKSDLAFTFVVCDQVSPNLTTHLAVTEVPTVVVFKDKVETGRIVGPQIQELVKLVQDTANGIYDADVANSKMTAAERKKELFSSLQELVHSQPVLIFMKGNKAHPFCKFSRGAIDILNSIKDLPYATFDILKNPEVREGLKEFGDWPTYPQLYAEGELIGGVDIMRQMSETGTLDVVLWEAVEKHKGQRIVDLRKLVRKAPVMLFMKGNPQQPFCGFSRKMVEILGTCGVDYDYFDILSDDDVRAGLKEVFEWPTYPQLYSNGSLVGGLDVVKQLVDNGGPARLKEELEAVAQEADDLPVN